MNQVDNAPVKINLTGIESNTIIACLAKEEYGKVFTLIPAIRNQAKTQIDAAQPADPNSHIFVYSLTGIDIKQIVSTLNKHPFEQVYTLVENIRTQAIPQLEAFANPDGEEQ